MEKEHPAVAAETSRNQVYLIGQLVSLVGQKDFRPVLGIEEVKESARELIGDFLYRIETSDFLPVVYGLFAAEDLEPLEADV